MDLKLWGLWYNFSMSPKSINRNQCVSACEFSSFWTNLKVLSNLSYKVQGKM